MTGGEPSRAAGNMKDTQGAVKEAVGSVFSDKMQAEGKADRAAGQAEVQAAKTKGYAEGQGDSLLGGLKKNVGSLFGNDQMEAEGKGRELKGDAKKEFNKLSAAASQAADAGLPLNSATGSSSTGADAPGISSFEQRAGQAAGAVTSLFPLWVLLGNGLALVRPQTYAWFRQDLVTAGLALTMLAMGTTLTLEDFTAVMRFPGRVLLGVTLQYTVMPLTAFLVSRLAGLPPAFAIGICLIGSCPGGTASNVVTFLAGADVALSVTLTSVSTLAAVAATPLLAKLLAGRLVPVDAYALFKSTIQVVLLPVLVGAYLNHRFPAAMKRIAPFAPLVAVTMVVLVCASVMSANAAAVRVAGGRLVAAIVALHSGGFALGYILTRVAGQPERVARTNSIEVGMQNSALGAVLALQHFADPLTPVPCAISACLHSILGSALAAAWRASDAGKPTETATAGA